MEFMYEENKPSTCKPQETLLREFSRNDLVQLLLYLEEQLESREQAITHLKKERTNLLHFEARYSRLFAGDPLFALKRDLQSLPPCEYEIPIRKIYESQYNLSEKIISKHHGEIQHIKSMFHDAESRYIETLRQLEAERIEKLKLVETADAILLRGENQRLTQEIQAHEAVVKKALAEVKRMDQQIEMDNKKHRTIVLYLMAERREMLTTIAELQLRKNNQAIDSSNIKARERELESLRAERDSLLNWNKVLKSENIMLKETNNSQEQEVMLLRKSCEAHDKKEIEERALVVTNREAVDSSRTLPSSSSFPSENSRLPRVLSSPFRQTGSSVPKPIVKKTPAMGLSTVRRATSGGGRSLIALGLPENVADPLRNPTIERASSFTRQIINHGANNLSSRTSSAKMQNVTPAVANSNISRPASGDVNIPQSNKSKSSLLRAFGK